MTEQTNDQTNTGQRASGLDGGACALPRKTETRETAAWSTHLLDLESCSRLEIVVTLFEHERANVRPSTWPHAVLNDIEQHIAEWLARNPQRAVTAISYAAPLYSGRQACCVIIHHHAKGS